MEEKVKVKSKGVFILTGICFMVVAIVFALLFFLNGSTKIDNTTQSVLTTESLVCESSQTAYPIFTYDNSEKKSMKINVIFMDDKIDKISLIYKLYYVDASKIKISESMNHADMNKSFSSDGLLADSLGATYSSLDDAMQMKLSAGIKDLTEVTAKYFLLKQDGSYYTRDRLAKKYNSEGFNCQIIN